MGWSGSPAGGSLTSGTARRSPYGWTWLWLAGLAQGLRNSYIITNSPEYASLRRFFKATVEGLQLVFDRSLVTSMQPRSFVSQMRDAVADCDDGSSEDGMMLLSMPHDIPESDVSSAEGNAGRRDPRCYHTPSDAGKQTPAAAGGRPSRGLCDRTFAITFRRFQICASPVPVCCRCWTHFRWTGYRDTPSARFLCGRRLIVTQSWRWRTATFESHDRISPI